MIEIKVPVIPGKKNHLMGKIEVEVGQKVAEGDLLCHVETAKGNREIKASGDGVVEKILVEEGDQVLVGDTLLILEEVEKEKQSLDFDLVEIKVPIIPGKKTHSLGKIEIDLGQKVEKGQVLCHVETAKGNREIKASESGLVDRILYEEGDDVDAGETLIILKIPRENQASEISEESSLEETGDEKIIKKDLLVIGAGPGGYVGAIYGAKCGLDVALVEKDRLGGTCLNVGCIPTKSLVESAHRLDMARELSDFGIDGPREFAPNMPKIVERKDGIVENLVSGIDHLLKKNEVDLLRSQASFLDDKRVKVGSTIIEAKNIIIATGSNENVLKIEGHDLKGVITSTEALDLKEIPETLLVIGGGVIGLEFASIFKTFGSQVHIIEYQDSLLPMFDKDCGSEMERICEEKDIRVSTSAKVTSIKESIEGKYIVTYEKDGKVLSSIGDKVLMATGRRANTQGLGLEKTRVMVNEKNGNILVDENRKTTVDHIFAIGDVSNRLKLAHLASHEAILAVDYILGDERSLLDKEIPSVVYTRPEIASIGYREEELKEKNISYKKSIFDFAANGKAMTMGENKGFIKLLAGDDDEILGCVIIGPDASNLIACLSLAIKNKLRAKDIMHTVFAHPTTSEVIHEAALDIHDRGIHQ